MRCAYWDTDLEDELNLGVVTIQVLVAQRSLSGQAAGSGLVLADGGHMAIELRASAGVDFPNPSSIARSVVPVLIANGPRLAAAEKRGL
jgi:hypothetical protein